MWCILILPHIWHDSASYFHRRVPQHSDCRNTRVTQARFNIWKEIPAIASASNLFYPVKYNSESELWSNSDKTQGTRIISNINKNIFPDTGLSITSSILVAVEVALIRSDNKSMVWTAVSVKAASAHYSQECPSSHAFYYSNLLLSSKSFACSSTTFQSSHWEYYSWGLFKKLKIEHINI